MPSSKITESLLHSLSNVRSEEPVDLVIELNSIPSKMPATGGRAERIAASEAAFEASAAPVLEQIRNLGGEVVKKAWINSTIRARLPQDKVELLSKAIEISKIDALRRLQADRQ